jgi:CheY-like chemotaxis protein
VPTSAKPIVVLVVEDEWILRETIAEQLREAGHEVIESQTAEDAIGHARSGRVQVVFTDIQLPGQLSGWDVAEQFRAAQADVGIIYTSGNAADRSRQLADSAFFEKPYDPAAVVAACKNTQAAARFGYGHYYLHIRDGDGRLVDPEGAIFVNLDAAKAEAVESAGN